MTTNLKLKNGVNIPQLGFGTYELTGDMCIQAVKRALETGYRHIDTAEFYGNESEIGRAIYGYKREDLFLTSKVWYTNLRYKDVLKACENSLKRLKTSYLDLYLVHWPNSGIDMEETFQALHELIQSGKIRAVGVSNFTISHLEKAITFSRMPICVNQVELHPGFNQRELLQYCTSKGIKVTAYSPLGRGSELKNPIILKIAEDHRRLPSQVVLRWHMQKGVIAIPKASTTRHIQENFDLDFELTKPEMAQLDDLPQKRLVRPFFAEF